MRTTQLLVKRVFDVCLSGIGLLILWPVILVCALLARKDTNSSGFFIQERVGRNGKNIFVRKIRTMRDVEGMDGNTITKANDPRITSLGRTLRNWKLDELPQLWNVFVGDMSFVGPRPDVPGYADRLLGHERVLLTIRPGITGPATIKYRNEEILLSNAANAQRYNDNVLYPDKVELNLAYMQTWTLWKDIQYILITLRILPVPRDLSVNSINKENTV